MNLLVTTLKAFSKLEKSASSSLLVGFGPSNSSLFPLKKSCAGPKTFPRTGTLPRLADSNISKGYALYL